MNAKHVHKRLKSNHKHVCALYFLFIDISEYACLISQLFSKLERFTLLGNSNWNTNAIDHWKHIYFLILIYILLTLYNHDFEFTTELLSNR